MKSRLLTSAIIGVLFLVPAISSADISTDIQSQVISLLQQIITLQKQLIESLQNQISQLQSQISQLHISTSNTQPHICAIINPPPCSATLTVSRDSYNCPTAYTCAPVAVTQPVQPTPPQTSPSCTFGNTPIGSVCGGFRHCFSSVGVAGGPGDVWWSVTSPIQPISCVQVAP